MGKEKIKVYLPWNETFGGGDYYELVEFAPDASRPGLDGCFLLRPVSKNMPNLKSMTKAQLIEYIEEQQL
jgi:hypothetical protein